MAPLANLHGITDTLPAIPKLAQPRHHASRTRPLMSGCPVQKTENSCGYQHASRRTALGLGLASVTLVGTFSGGASLAEDNGFWIIGPIPPPPVYSKIANEDTGTRSFVKSRMYIPDVGEQGSRYRLRKHAFDLLALGDLVQKDLLNYVRRFLILKGTFMYYDFDKVISAAPESEKQPLTDLANKLFDSVEKLEQAAKREDFPATESYYKDTAIILQEVRDGIKYKSTGFLGVIGLWNLDLWESV